MRIPYFFAFVILIQVNAGAQQLDAGDLSFVPGETFNFGSIPWSEPGAGGVAQIWDFSEVAPAGELEYTWEAPSDLDQIAYPGITVVRDVAFSCTEYWQAAPDRFSELGNRCGITLSSYTYEDPRDVIRYPFAFGDTYTDTYGGMYRVGGGQPDSSAIDATITVTADATGTLILPWTTHTGVLRLHLEQEEELVDDGRTFYTDEYWYVLPGVHMPLLKLIRSWDDLEPKPLSYATVQLPNSTSIAPRPAMHPIDVHWANGLLSVQADAAQLVRCDVFLSDGRSLGHWDLDPTRALQLLPVNMQAVGLVSIRFTDQAGRTTVERLVITP